MIGVNIFNLNNNNKIRTKKENQIYWENIKIIYDIFNAIISNEKMDPNILKHYIKYDFLNKLINIFKSDNEDEKEMLKTIISKLYSKLSSRRKLIRGVIFNYFNFGVITLNKINGAVDLLDVMENIISQFSIPLKDEYINIFDNLLIPLHKMKKCYKYFDNLNRCILLFLEKDSNLAYNLLENLYAFFPSHNYKVKNLFLEEIIMILEYIDIKKIEKNFDKLMRVLVDSFLNFNNDLKNKALSFFENKIFISIININTKISFNIIVPFMSYLPAWDKESKSSLNKINQNLKKMNLLDYNNALKKIKEIEFNKYSIVDNTFINKNNTNEKKDITEILSEYFEKLKLEEEFDENFGICPITRDYMKDPVICPSGNYYDKSAILNWLKDHDTEPLTRQHLTPEMLKEDEEYKRKIIHYRIKFNK